MKSENAPRASVFPAWWEMGHDSCHCTRCISSAWEKNTVAPARVAGGKFLSCKKKKNSPFPKIPEVYGRNALDLRAHFTTKTLQENSHSIPSLSWSEGILMRKEFQPGSMETQKVLLLPHGLKVQSLISGYCLSGVSHVPLILAWVFSQVLFHFPFHSPNSGRLDILNCHGVNECVNVCARGGSSSSQSGVNSRTKRLQKNEWRNNCPNVPGFNPELELLPGWRLAYSIFLMHEFHFEMGAVL